MSEKNSLSGKQYLFQIRESEDGVEQKNPQQKQLTSLDILTQVNRDGINYMQLISTLPKNKKIGTPTSLLNIIQKKFGSGGLLIQGENLSILSLLSRIPKINGQIGLVYIDPPFGTKQSFTITDNRVATISRSNGGKVAYHDHLYGDAYLDFLRSRLAAIREIMANEGSIYVHIDYKVGHYVKCLMDEIFGQKNFINDIARIKCNPKNFSRAGYGNMKDMILFYTKTKRFIWNDVKKVIDIALKDDRFRYVDSNGRHYTTTPLHAPGETLNGPTGKPWRGIFPPKGRHWRYPPEVLEQLDRKGSVEWSSTGNPRKKIYAEEIMNSGIKIQDVWTFKDPQTPSYPTAKNMEMLKLIVANSSRPGDIILDAFCGSGTTLLAARELGRRWIGIDSSREAIAVAIKRLPGCGVIRV